MCHYCLCSDFQTMCNAFLQTIHTKYSFIVYIELFVLFCLFSLSRTRAGHSELAGYHRIHVQCLYEIRKIIRVRYSADVSGGVRSCTSSAARQGYRCCINVIVKCHQQNGHWFDWFICTTRRISHWQRWQPQRCTAQDGERGGRTHIGSDNMPHLHGSRNRYELYTMRSHYLMPLMCWKVSAIHSQLFTHFHKEKAHWRLNKRIDKLKKPL